MPQGLRYGRANRHRGEIEALFNGERRILCLSSARLPSSKPPSKSMT